MLVLGLDPGTATTGYGLVEYVRSREKMIAYGTIKTSAGIAMNCACSKYSRSSSDPGYLSAGGRGH